MKVFFPALLGSLFGVLLALVLVVCGWLYVPATRTVLGNAPQQCDCKSCKEKFFCDCNPDKRCNKDCPCSDAKRCCGKGK